MVVAAPIFKAINNGMNAVMVPLIHSPADRLVGRVTTLVTYTGRRSGKTFTTPVLYRRKGSEVRIAVAMPDEKTWWRNFEGDGGPLQLRLGGVEHPGHGVARRDEKGRVTVTVTLTG